LAQNAYNYANTISISLNNQFILDTANTANGGNTTAHAAFDRANTALTSTALAFNAANSAQVQADSAYNKANTVGIHANAAFDIANGALGLSFTALAVANTVNGAFDKANSANILAQSSYDFANTVNTTLYLTIADEVAAFAKANAANSLAQGAFLHANSAFDKANLTTQIYNHSNSAYNTANTALATAAIALNYDNFANAAFDKANSANVLAQQSYDTANTKVSKSGDTMTGDLKFNGGGGILNLPTNQIAITANVDNDASGFIAQATGVSTVYANTDVQIQANTGGATFSIWNFNTNGTITFPDSTTQTTAFTGSAIDQVARNTANAANVLAQNAYNYANTLGINVANSLIIVTTAPANNKGAGGDTKGMVYLANDYFYYCTTAHDGTTNIWSRIASTDAW